MVHCTVKGCKNRTERKTANITFHTFPPDQERRKLWIKSTGRPNNWKPKKYDRICSRHFEENCFRRSKVKVYVKTLAVPTLDVHQVDSSDEDINSNDTDNSDTISLTSTDCVDNTYADYAKYKSEDINADAPVDMFLEDVDRHLKRLSPKNRLLVQNEMKNVLTSFFLKNSRERAKKTKRPKCSVGNEIINSTYATAENFYDKLIKIEEHIEDIRDIGTEDSNANKKSREDKNILVYSIQSGQGEVEGNGVLLADREADAGDPAWKHNTHDDEKEIKTEKDDYDERESE